MQDAFNEVLDVVSAVGQLAVVRDFDAVHDFGGADLGHVGQAGQDADAVEVTKAALDVVFHVE